MSSVVQEDENGKQGPTSTHAEETQEGCEAQVHHDTRGAPGDGGGGGEAKAQGAPSGRGVVERDAERLAWTVLGVAFVVLCLFVVSVPQAVRWYLAHAMSERPIRLEVNKGTAFWLPSGGRQEVNAANDALVSVGGQVRTAADSRAFLSLFDGSNVQLWPQTTLRVVSSQSTTYSSNDTDVVLAQDLGHARYNVALPETAARHFEVRTPQADVLFREGSYRVEVDDGSTVVTVSDGSATVSARDHAVEALRGESVKVP